MKFNSWNTSLIAILLLISANSHAAVQSFQESLSAQLIEYMETEVERLTAKGYRSVYEIGSVDPRLQLNACETELKLSPSRSFLDSTQNTILVECAGTSPWKLYIPVSIEIYGKQVLAKRPLVKGTHIQISDLTLRESLINKTRQAYYTRLDDVVGMKLKRNVKAERVIGPKLLAAPSLINKGDEVLIIAANQSIKIQMKGEALRGGSHGQQIPVKNLKSQRIIKARVLGQGKVSVPM